MLAAGRRMACDWRQSSATGGRWLWRLIYCCQATGLRSRGSQSVGVDQGREGQRGAAEPHSRIDSAGADPASAACGLVLGSRLRLRQGAVGRRTGELLSSRCSSSRR